MVSLSDLGLRTQTLNGQIKQADADIAESELLVRRAEQALERERETLKRNQGRAETLRTERNELADSVHAKIRTLGEPEPADEPTQTAYEVTRDYVRPAASFENVDVPATVTP